MVASMQWTSVITRGQLTNNGFHLRRSIAKEHESHGRASHDVEVSHEPLTRVTRVVGSNARPSTGGWFCRCGGRDHTLFGWSQTLLWLYWHSL